MGDFRILSNEMGRLREQINTVLGISGYLENYDMSGLSDFSQIKTADQRQQLEEYGSIMCRLEEIKRTFDYYARPVREVGTLHENGQGRFETESGHYYTSGCGIEFLRTEEVYDFDKQEWKDVEIWTTSSVESDGGNYYIVGYRDVELDGLKVRVRRNEK